MSSLKTEKLESEGHEFLREEMKSKVYFDDQIVEEDLNLLYIV